MALKTGIAELDKAIAIEGGIIALRSADRRLLDEICESLLWRNLSPPKRTLVLQFSDYHERYWSINFDRLAFAARRGGGDVDALLDHAHFLRVFCRDGVEVQGNWDRIFSSCNDLSLVILDSASDLYSGTKRPANTKAMLYMIGMFGRLCAMNGCAGVALDCTEKRAHPYLGELCSIVVDVKRDQEISFRISKHCLQPDSCTTIWKKGSLRRWLA